MYLLVQEELQKINLNQMVKILTYCIVHPNTKNGAVTHNPFLFTEQNYLRKLSPR